MSAVPTRELAALLGFDEVKADLCDFGRTIRVSASVGEGDDRKQWLLGDFASDGVGFAKEKWQGKPIAAWRSALEDGQIFLMGRDYKRVRLCPRP